MTQAPRFYRESGAFEIVGLVLMAVAAILGGVVCGFLYGYWDAYIPIIIITWIGTVVAPVVVGFAVGFAASFGKVRNAALTGAFGLFGGLVLLYFSWVGWIHAQSGSLPGVDEAVLALSPGELFKYLGWFAENWSISVGKGGRNGIPISGIFLHGIWVIEAAMLVLGPAALAWTQVAEEPFCEQCHRWIEVGSTLHKGLAESTDKYKAELEAGRLETFFGLPGVDPSAPVALHLELRRCDGCKRVHYLTVRHVVRSVDEKGQESFDKTALAVNLEVSAAAYQGLLDGKKPEDAQAAL